MLFFHRIPVCISVSLRFEKLLRHVYHPPFMESESMFIFGLIILHTIFVICSKPWCSTSSWGCYRVELARKPTMVLYLTRLRSWLDKFILYMRPSLSSRPGLTHRYAQNVCKSKQSLFEVEVRA